jgi:hypothetical protein
MALLPTTMTAGTTGHVAHSVQLHKKANDVCVDVVADFGAAGNGSTDDTTAINNAITAAAALGAGGGTVYFPPGTYSHSGTIVGKSNVRLLGASRYATIIKRSANVVSCSFYGADTDNRCSYASMEHLTWHGNDFNATMLDFVYASQFTSYSIAMFGGYGRAMDLVEMWDSHFTKTFIEFVGGETINNVPSIHIRNGRAGSGFGSSVDNSNEIRFTNLHLEQFRACAVKIEPSVGTANPNGFYFFNVKCENHFLSAGQPYFYIAPEVDRFHLERLYAFVNTFDAGESTPINVIHNLSNGMTSLRDIYISNGAVTNVVTGVTIDTGGTGYCIADGIYGNYTTAPTTAHVNVVNAANLELGNVRTNTGTNIAGYQLATTNRALRLTSNLTTTSTTVVDATGLMFQAVPVGEYVLELSGLYQSSLTTAGPRIAVGGTATATGIGGSVAMDTSTTTTTTGALTAVNTGVGANPGTATTSFRAATRVSFSITAAGTFGIRWLESAASTGTLVAGTYATLTRIK